MPRRLIDSRLCGSDKFNGLPSDVERLLYILMIINADAYGREEASPMRLKAMCFPAREIKLERIETAIKRLHSAALCNWYEVENKMYYEITRWEDFQCFNSKNRRYKSRFPDTQCSTVPHSDNSDSEGEGESKENSSCPKFEDRHLKLARHLAKLIIKHNSKTITLKKSQGPQWANIFRLMEKHDGVGGIPLDEIQRIIDWAFTDDFWYAQLQSAGAVRKHWNKLVAKESDSEHAKVAKNTKSKKTLELDEIMKKVADGIREEERQVLKIRGTAQEKQ